MTFNWGAVCRAKQGQTVSGDRFVVRHQDEGTLLAAVIDGLGGGVEAARAAILAEQTLETHPEQPLQDLTKMMHTALHQTRGAVSGLLRLEAPNARATFVGVGNIGIHVYSRRSIKPISKSGILGFRLPTLLEMRYTYDPGDVFVLFSDGVSGRFGQDGQFDPATPPQPFAELLLSTYGKTTDDATVLVIHT